MNLVFFLHVHVGTGPGRVVDTMALVFGVLIVPLSIGESSRIMGHLDHGIIPTDRTKQTQG